jgi:lysophospholipase L1-like esterase
LRQEESEGGWENGWKRKMINSGKDGGTIEFFLEKFEFMIGRFRPDLVIVSLGFNHLEVEDGGGDELTKMARELFEKIRDLGVEIACWSTYKVPNEKYNPALEMVGEIYRELCTELGEQFVDIYQEFCKQDLDRVFTYRAVEDNDLWQIKAGERDYLHCNEVGNKLIAEKLMAEVFGRKLVSWEGFGNMRG